MFAFHATFYSTTHIWKLNTYFDATQISLLLLSRHIVRHRIRMSRKNINSKNAMVLWISARMTSDDRHAVWNHQQFDCLFSLTLQNTLTLFISDRMWWVSTGHPLVISGFPLPLRASNGERVSMVQRLHGSVGHWVRGSGFYNAAKVINLGATTQKATNISIRSIDSVFFLFDIDINSNATDINQLINQYYSRLLLILDYAYKNRKTIFSEILLWVQTHKMEWPHV